MKIIIGELILIAVLTDLIAYVISPVLGYLVLFFILVLMHNSKITVYQCVLGEDEAINKAISKQR